MSPFASLPPVLRAAGVRSFVEIVLVVALAAQAANLVWVVAAPRPASAADKPAPPTDLAVLMRFNPFLGGDAPAGAGTTGEGLRLYGVRADGQGRGSAIIGTADGRQRPFLVGETIAPGVTLQAVHADHVVLQRGGVPTRLAFPNANP